MMDRDAEQIKKRIRAGAFADNNGRVMRAINILRHTYNRLRDIKYALPDISEAELLDSINYLHEAGYIHLRDVETREPTATGLADVDYMRLEAKLTDKGIRLLAYAIRDDVVKV